MKTTVLRYCWVGNCITLLAAKAKPLNFSSRCRDTARTGFVGLLPFVPRALRSSTLKCCWARCLFSGLQQCDAAVCKCLGLPESLAEALLSRCFFSWVKLCSGGSKGMLLPSHQPQSLLCPLTRALALSSALAEVTSATQS